MIFDDVIFRARKKEDGQWIEGAYFHIIRKTNMHVIIDRDTNNQYEIIRETLGLKVKYINKETNQIDWHFKPIDEILSNF